MALCGILAVHLGADTPGGVAIHSVGLYIDEGYKTLDARNMALYGTIQPRSHDDFAGFWAASSPLVFSLQLAAFRALGVELANARIVSLLFFGVFLLFYVIAFHDRYGTPIFLAGLVCLTIPVPVFFISRLAIVDAPLLAFCYYPLFFTARFGERSPRAVVLVLCAALVLGTFLIKRSALIYLLPALVGVVLSQSSRTRLTRRWLYLCALAVGASAFTFWFVSRSSLAPYIAVRPPKSYFPLVLNALTVHSPFWVAAGFLSLSCLLLAAPRGITLSPYQGALTAMVLVGPVVLWLLPYHPLRYYAPLLPAFPLLVLEWYHQRLAGNTPPAGVPWWRFVLAVPLLGAAFMPAGRGVSGILRDLGLALDLERSPLALVLVALALALAGSWVAIKHGRRFLCFATVVVVVLTVLAAVGDVRRIGAFLAAPSYRGLEVSALVNRLTFPGAVVAGDWAPYLAFRAEVVPIFMTEGVNYPSPERLRLIRPDYFLDCDTRADGLTRAALRDEVGVQLVDSGLRSSYAGRPIRLFAVRYPQRLEPR